MRSAACGAESAWDVVPCAPISAPTVGGGTSPPSPIPMEGDDKTCQHSCSSYSDWRSSQCWPRTEETCRSAVSDRSRSMRRPTRQVSTARRTVGLSGLVLPTPRMLTSHNGAAPEPATAAKRLSQPDLGWGSPASRSYVTLAGAEDRRMCRGLPRSNGHDRRPRDRGRLTCESTSASLGLTESGLEVAIRSSAGTAAPDRPGWRRLLLRIGSV